MLRVLSCMIVLSIFSYSLSVEYEVDDGMVPSDYS